MNLENIVIPIGNKKEKAIKINSENSSRVVKDINLYDNYVVYTTFKGDTYKSDYDFNNISPLCVDKQYYLDLD